jgi:pimeloyl-ACP methyl ester carboxylesterase
MLKWIASLIMILAPVITTHAQPRQLKANGISIAFESFGDSAHPAIILINGTSSPMTDWPRPFCERLASQGYRVIRFDHRDVGMSSRLDSLGQPDWARIAPFAKTCQAAPLPYTLLDMAKDVSGLMDALHLPKAHIAGVSMGGAIAQLIAIHFPERVLTLSSIAASSGNPDLPAGDEKTFQAMSTPPPATNNQDTLAAYLVRIYQALGSTDDEETLHKRAVESIRHSWYPAGSARHVAAVWIGDNCDRRPGLATIKVPVMVIHGDADPLVKLSSGKDVAAAIPHAQLCVINGLGHDLSTKYLDRIADCIVQNARKYADK